MDESQSRFKCPECDRAVLNRKIDKCLFCGAALPSELLLSKEAIAELNRQQQELKAQSRQTASQSVSDSSGSNWDLGSVVDTIDIATDVIDIAGDVIGGISSLLE
jgi:hypothetical protein